MFRYAISIASLYLTRNSTRLMFKQHSLALRLFFTTVILLFTFSSFAQIEFVENKGQWDKSVKFMSNAGNGAFYLQAKGFTVVQHDQKDLTLLMNKVHQNQALQRVTPNKKTLKSHAYNVEFINANPSAQIVPDKALSSVNNYFIGNDKSKWASNCKIYGAVIYKNVYPGIDVRYYNDAGNRLKYDIIAQPGADISKIALRYKGVDGLKVKNKELLINTSVGENKELYPYSYQVINNQRQEVEANYVVDGDIVKFKVKGYSPQSTLIIDPTEIFFSYTGSTADNWGFTATYGPDGSFFSGGIVFATGFPVSTGAYNETFNNGDFDIGIMKLSPNGSNRIYATYIGGSGEEQPHSLFSDKQGNLVIAGRTNSGDSYPTTSPTYGGGGKWDIIVTKLNASGSALIGSMRIGGSENDGVNIKDHEAAQGTASLNRNYGDDARSEVLLDDAGNIYVASSSLSDDFKTSAGAFQPTYSGDQDAVVLKLNPAANSVLFSTYLGGSKNDAAYVLTLGNTGNIYVAGGTESNDFRGISAAGVISPTYAPDASTGKPNPCDGYVLELTPDGANVVRGTFLGTPSADQVYGIQTDKFGSIYVMGTTEGSWTVLNAAFVNAGAKQFISKIQPDLSAYVYSTTFGSKSTFPNISPTAFLVDRCENVYVSGWGGKANALEGYAAGNTIGMPVTADAIKSQTDPSGSDFYFFVLKKDAASQLYGTFFGQLDPVNGGSPETFGDHVDGGTSRFDKNGVIYQAMCANCNRTVNFLGTPGAWSTSNQASSGGRCNLGMLKIEMNFAGVAASPVASIEGVKYDTIGCAPLLVDFSDSLLRGKRYVWDFGDGSPQYVSTSPNVSHLYNTVGKYRVMQVAIDSATCNVADTAYVTITAGSNKANLAFVANKLEPCTNLSYRFDNTSLATNGSFSPQSFTWDFGDGSAPLVAGTEPVNHTYAGPGTYIVKLSFSDSLFCNSPDDTAKTIRLSPQVKAAFVTPPSGCIPYTAVFQNTSLGGLNFLWNFGDGTTSAVDNPTHDYLTPGTYRVSLIAFDSSSCNKIDSTFINISVQNVPTAGFSFTPTQPQENTFTQFTNQSAGAINYFWNFGDGDSSTEVNPRHIFPATGTYNVCLVAENEAGCTDTACLPVQALINPLLDVPSAFTPGKFGVNSVVGVRGFGIKTMNWKIYNRWGQLVFESTSPKSGWDGTYKGKLQPMDVYTYTLDVIFSDGKKLRKTGDITLIK